MVRASPGAAQCLWGQVTLAAGGYACAATTVQGSAQVPPGGQTRHCVLCQAGFKTGHHPPFEGGKPKRAAAEACACARVRVCACIRACTDTPVSLILPTEALHPVQMNTSGRVVDVSRGEEPSVAVLGQFGVESPWARSLGRAPQCLLWSRGSLAALLLSHLRERGSTDPVWPLAELHSLLTGCSC